MVEKYCVYLLYSKKTNKYYIGKTCNINRRFIEHCNGEETYTRTGRPWILIGTIDCTDNSHATILENKLKKSRNKKYIQWYFEKNGNIIDTLAGR